MTTKETHDNLTRTIISDVKVDIFSYLFKVADYRYENALLHNAHPDKVAVLAFERAMSLDYLAKS